MISQAAMKDATGATLTATPQAIEVTVQNNDVRMAANPMGNGIILRALRNSSVQGNNVRFNPASTADNYGIVLALCGWTDACDNKVEYAPQAGIYVLTSNDIRITDNQVVNPGESAARGTPGGSPYGVYLLDVYGSTVVRGNQISDDRAAHAMSYGILAAPEVFAFDNHIRGAATAPTFGTATIAGLFSGLFAPA